MLNSNKRISYTEKAEFLAASQDFLIADVAVHVFIVRNWSHLWSRWRSFKRMGKFAVLTKLAASFNVEWTWLIVCG